MPKAIPISFDGDEWLNDKELRSVSSGARGLWMDMLSLMSKSVRRGYLQLDNGKLMSAEILARLTGNSTDEVSHWLRELDDSGVFSKSETGIIYNRRIVREEQDRTRIRLNVKKHRERNRPVIEAVIEMKSGEGDIGGGEVVFDCSQVQLKTPEEAGMFVLPEWVPEEQWNAFVAMRKAIKKPLATNYAKSLAVKKLAELKALGSSPVAVLERSIANSWQGLFVVPGGNGNGNSKTKSEQRTERNVRIARELAQG